MKIKRTFKQRSLRRGKTDFIEEPQMRTIAGQTDMAFHGKGQCGTFNCSYCCEPAMTRLKAGAKIEDFFTEYQIVEV